VLSSLPDLQKERGFPHPSRKKKLLKFKRESTRSAMRPRAAEFEDNSALPALGNRARTLRAPTAPLARFRPFAARGRDGDPGLPEYISRHIFVWWLGLERSLVWITVGAILVIAPGRSMPAGPERPLKPQGPAPLPAPGQAPYRPGALCCPTGGNRSGGQATDGLWWAVCG
jgi:hypothetical protein